MNIAVDTNIIINLYFYSIGEHDKLKAFSKENFYCLKYLNQILKKDFENGKNIIFFYSPQVYTEFLSGDLNCRDMGYINYAKKYGEFFTLNKQEKKYYGYLLNLLLGKNNSFPEYLGKPIFSNDAYGNLKDCKIMVECGIKNLHLLTLNIKDFIGVMDDEIRKNIKERFTVYSKHFNIDCSQSYPITISEFIKMYYPEEYKNMQNEIKQSQDNNANNKKILVTIENGILNLSNETYKNKIDKRYY